MRLVTIGIEPISEYLMFRTTFTSTTEGMICRAYTYYGLVCPLSDYNYHIFSKNTSLFRVFLNQLTHLQCKYTKNIWYIQAFSHFFFIFIYFLGHRDTSLTRPTALKIRNFAHIYKHLTWQYVRLGTNYGIFNKNELLLPFS